MKQYIATKYIMAERAFRVFIPGTLPKIVDADHVPDGCRAEDGYRIKHDFPGSETWLPKNIFEQYYRSTDRMNFGLAIEAARCGCKIFRRGWSKKGTYVVYRTGYPEGIHCNKNTADAIGIPEGTLFKVQPYLQMRCEDGSFQMWTASQSDILADDWGAMEV